MLYFHLLYHVLAIFCILPIAISDDKRTAMKVVDEPTNYGLGYGYGYQQQSEPSSTLHLRVQPSNYSGPDHLRRLVGKCFTRTDDTYKYELCPFSNVTQHEQSLRWNPYSGVLGVWQEWEIENNTFVAMMMREGDACGSVFRSVRVLFECGNHHEIDKVSEPHTCQYEMILRSPLVCHPHAMLVYPTLPENLQREWDKIEGQLQAGEITQQGYRKFVHRRVFEKAGFVLAESQRTALAEQALQQGKKEEREKQGEFDTLDKCTEEYKKLKDEIQSLNGLLELHGISPDDAQAANQMQRDGFHSDDLDYDNNVRGMAIEDPGDDW